MPRALDRLAKHMILSGTVGVGHDYLSRWQCPRNVFHNQQHADAAGPALASRSGKPRASARNLRIPPPCPKRHVDDAAEEIRRVLGSGELLLTQQPTAELRFREFFSSTFENWQSELLQLVCQAVLLFLGLISVERER